MTQIKLRRDTSANFASANPVLGVGEPAYETDTKKLKIGDGTTAYTQLEYFSTGGGGSTNITATLPLKIVDGVISLEVDGQTIQIVDGKLHANLDELGNKVNSLTGEVTDLSGRVTAAEADILTKENKITTTGALSLQEKIISNLTNMTETETQITPNKTQNFTVNSSEFHFLDQLYNAPQCYIAIPYQFGQWLKIPGGFNIQPSVLFGHFLEDGDFLITAAFSGNCYESDYPIYGGIVRGAAPVSFSTYSGKVYLNSYGQVSEKAMNSNIIFTETDPCAYLQLIDNTSNNNIICGSYNYGYGPNSYGIKGYAETHVVYNRDLTNYTVQDFVRDTTTALIMSPSASYPILKSAVGLYAATGRLGWNQDGYNQLKANLGENLFDLTKSQVNNYLELNLGDGLSVVDGKLTASGVTELPIASTTALGGIKVGDNLSITADGTLSATGGGLEVKRAPSADFNSAALLETGLYFISGAKPPQNGPVPYAVSAMLITMKIYAASDNQHIQQTWIGCEDLVANQIYTRYSRSNGVMTSWVRVDSNKMASSSELGSIKVGDGLTISSDGTLSATGGGSAPSNMVTTDTAQTISGDKAFTGKNTFSNQIIIPSDFNGVKGICIDGQSNASIYVAGDYLNLRNVGQLSGGSGSNLVIGTKTQETQIRGSSITDGSGNKFLTSGDKETIMGYIMPDYSTRTEVPWNTDNTAPTDGYVEIFGEGDGSTSAFILEYTINGVKTAVSSCYATSRNTNFRLPVICPKGTVYSARGGALGHDLHFISMKGAV